MSGVLWKQKKVLLHKISPHHSESIGRPSNMGNFFFSFPMKAVKTLAEPGVMRKSFPKSFKIRDPDLLRIVSVWTD